MGLIDTMDRDDKIFKEAMKKAKEDRIASIEKIISKAPPMNLTNQEFWQKVVDSIPKGSIYLDILAFTERWARLMEQSKFIGVSFDTSAEICLRVADYNDNVADLNMQTWSVALLSKTWKYGTELWCWYIRKHPREAFKAIRLPGD